MLNRVGVYLTLSVMAVLFVGGLFARIAYLKADRNRVAFVADSTAAANDSTHALEIDSLRTAYVRRIIQTDLEKSDLNKKLKTESKLRVAAEAKIKSLSLVDSGRVASQPDGTTVVSLLKTDTPPFDTLNIEVAIKPNMPPLFFVDFVFSTFHLNVDVQCGQPKNGIRPATILFETPSYMKVSLDTLHQSREVCNPNVRVPTSNVKKYAVVGVTGIVIGGFIYSKRKR